MTLHRQDIEDYMNRWLGYGNPNGKYWFIGLEETFGRWNGQNDRQDLEEYVKARTEIGRTVDLRDAIEGIHGYELSNWSGTSTWLYQGVFLMQLDERHPDIAEMEDPGRQAYQYVFEEANLARSNSESLTAELLPLPKPLGEIEPLHDFRWETHAEYKRAVLPTRVNLIWNTLRDNEDVECVVAYGSTNEASLGLRVLSGADYESDEKVAVGQSPTRIYELELSEERTVNLVHSPFFGVGQLSYEQVGQIADAAGNR